MCFLNNLHQVTLNNLIGFKIICLFQAQWKLTAILLLFDAYTKLVHQRQNGDQRHRPLPDSVLYSALEWDLYFNYFLALLGIKVVYNIRYVSIK
jgi:hypothetical protein